jgi:hypothetical protein
MKSITTFFKRIFCLHREYDMDNQIRIMKCIKCGKEAWLRDIKDLFK